MCPELAPKLLENAQLGIHFAPIKALGHTDAQNVRGSVPAYTQSARFSTADWVPPGATPIESDAPRLDPGDLIPSRSLGEEESV